MGLRRIDRDVARLRPFPASSCPRTFRRRRRARRARVCRSCRPCRSCRRVRPAPPLPPRAGRAAPAPPRSLRRRHARRCPRRAPPAPSPAAPCVPALPAPAAPPVPPPSPAPVPIVPAAPVDAPARSSLVAARLPGPCPPSCRRPLWRRRAARGSGRSGPSLRARRASDTEEQSKRDAANQRNGRRRWDADDTCGCGHRRAFRLADTAHRAHPHGSRRVISSSSHLRGRLTRPTTGILIFCRYRVSCAHPFYAHKPDRDPEEQCARRRAPLAFLRKRGDGEPIIMMTLAFRSGATAAIVAALLGACQGSGAGGEPQTGTAGGGAHGGGAGTSVAGTTGMSGAGGTAGSGAGGAAGSGASGGDATGGNAAGGNERARGGTSGNAAAEAPAAVWAETPALPAAASVVAAAARPGRRPGARTADRPAAPAAARRGARPPARAAARRHRPRTTCRLPAATPTPGP